MQLTQPLFFNIKERVIFCVFLLCVACATLGFKYYQFYALKSQSNPQVRAEVLLQYTKQKNNKIYFVLKLKSDFGVFYTTTYEDLRDIRNREILLRLKFSNITFLEFLKGFYASSFSMIVLPKNTFKQDLRAFIMSQHSTQIMGEYYLALFLADSLPKAWREVAQSYGIAHLFAISGFHTGILSAVAFLILGFLYKPLHKRFFPFRNFFFDVGFVVISLLFMYYFLLTQSPSYLRALAMSGIAFFFLWRGISLWRIETLFWCVLSLLALFPSLVFSVGFYFSSLGVLYIFLFFKYFKIPQGFMQRCMYGIALNASTFFLMGIVVYYFFPLFSPLSLFSLMLTPLFSLYYPLALIAHLLGIGGILDSILLGWLAFPTHTIALEVSFMLFCACNVLNVMAIFSRSIFLGLLGLNCAYFCYGLYLYFYGF